MLLRNIFELVINILCHCSLVEVDFMCKSDCLRLSGVLLDRPERHLRLGGTFPTRRTGLAILSYQCPAKGYRYFNEVVRTEVPQLTFQVSMTGARCS